MKDKPDISCDNIMNGFVGICVSVPAIQSLDPRDRKARSLGNGETKSPLWKGLYRCQIFGVI